MAQRVLMIVESPNKAKKIRGYFSNFNLMATVGHFKDLPRDAMGVEPPLHQPEYVVSEGKQAFIAKLKAAAKEADLIYVATDPDREGEAIAAHVVNTLGKSHSGKVSRITYTEITRKAIEQAIKSKRSVDWSLVRAQEARRVLDRYVGYLVSPELTKKFKAKGINTSLSAGRVQSVAVKLVDERQRAIESFEPIKHYGIAMTLVKAGIEFEAVWKPLVAKGELIIDVNEAKRVMERTHSVKVMKVLNVQRKVAAPKPLITSSYVRLMAAALKMTTKAAMDAAQKLFEAGLITYHRTDSPVMSDEFVQEVRAFAERNKLPLPATQRTVKVAANAQQGHECLRVTDINLMNPRLAGVDDDLLKAVYELVWMVTLQSQLVDGEDIATTVCFQNASEDVFASRARSVKLSGWRAAAAQFRQSNSARESTAELDSNEDQEEAAIVQTIPSLTESESLTPLSVTLQDKITEPDSPYTEKTLVEKLDKLGIGRPSTYAATIERIIQMQYVERNNKTLQLTATPFGSAMVSELDKQFGFMEYRYTADVEMSFDLIAQRKADYVSVVHTAWESLQNELNRYKANEVTGSVSAIDSAAIAKPSVSINAKAQPKGAPGEICPICGKGHLSVKKLGSGERAGRDFIGCSNFPICRFFQWMH